MWADVGPPAGSRYRARIASGPRVQRAGAAPVGDLSPDHGAPIAALTSSSPLAQCEPVVAGVRGRARLGIETPRADAPRSLVLRARAAPPSTMGRRRCGAGCFSTSEATPDSPRPSRPPASSSPSSQPRSRRKAPRDASNEQVEPPRVRRLVSSSGRRRPRRGRRGRVRGVTARRAPARDRRRHRARAT